MKLQPFVAVSVLTASLLAWPAHAGLMLQPAGISTDMGSFPTFEPVYAIDQSGLSASYVSGVTDFDDFVPTTTTDNGGSSFNTWFSASGNTTGQVDFDLGGTFNIGSFAYWADPQGIGQSINIFTLLADDNASFSSPTTLGTYNASDGPGSGPPSQNNANNFGQVFEFTPTSASFVRLQILSNHGSTLTTGISEAAFETVVPEPTSLGLLGGALLFGGRRSRRMR